MHNGSCIVAWWLSPASHGLATDESPVSQHSIRHRRFHPTNNHFPFFDIIIGRCRALSLSFPSVLPRAAFACSLIGGHASRQDGLGGDELGSVVASALPSARRRPPRLLRAEPLPRWREVGHLRPLHAGAEPHGVPAPILLVQPLLRRQAQGQAAAAAQGQAGRVAGDRRHRGGGARGGGAHQDRAQALLLPAHLRPQLLRALLLLRARALGGQQVAEAAGRHEEHHLPQLHHPGGHRRLARAHRHGDHQLHRQVHLQEQGHLLRNPRRRRSLRALVQSANARIRRPQQVLPVPEQPPHRQRQRRRQQGAALRRGANADGTAGASHRRRRGEEGEEAGAAGDPGQRASGAHAAADHAALAGLRARRAGQAAVHAHHRVQPPLGPSQAHQANLAPKGMPVLVNLLILLPQLIDDEHATPDSDHPSLPFRCFFSLCIIILSLFLSSNHHNICLWL